MIISGFLTNSRAKEIPAKSLKKIFDDFLGKIYTSLESPRDSTEEIYLTIIAIIIVNQYKTAEVSSEYRSNLLPKILTYLGVPNVSIEWDESWEHYSEYHREYYGYLIDYIYQYLLDNKKNQGHVASQRKKQGSYFTPFPVAYYIVSETFGDQKISPTAKIVDPAVGTGTFISALAHFLNAERLLDIENITNLLYGYDKDEVALKISGLVLATEFSISLDFIDNQSYPYHAKCLDFITVKIPNVNNFQENLFGDLEARASSPEISHFFDFLVMNPPYDRLKPDSESAEEKDRLKLYVDTLKASSQYSDISGSVDLYRLFLEKSLYVTGTEGRVGAIVPRTFLADKSAKSLRIRILNSNFLEKVLLIPEKLRTFEGVTQAYCIIILDKRAVKKNIEVACSETKYPDKGHEFYKVPYPLAKHAFPSHAYIAVLDHVGYELINHLNKYPKLSAVPFISNKRGELDLTLNANYIGEGNGILLRGRHIREFQVSGSDAVRIEAFKEKLKNSSKLYDLSCERLACQQISNNDSLKRMKFSYVPPEVVLGNSLNYITIENQSSDSGWSIFAVLGVLNSIILDWRFNATSSNNHVNNYEIDDLPFPLYCGKSEITKIAFLAKQLSISNSQNNEVRKHLEIAVLNAFDAQKFAPYLCNHHGLGFFLENK